MFVRISTTNADLPSVVNVSNLYVGPATTKLGTLGKIRLYINGMLFPPLESLNSLNGYIVECNYDDEEGNIDQGRFNPYILRPSWFDQLLGRADNITVEQLKNNAPYGIPPGVDPAVYYGSGKVPTQRSLNGSISWFYIPQDSVNQPGSGFVPYSLDSQSELIKMSENACGTDTNDYYANYTSIPGWDTGGTAAPLQTSICQMSNAVNQFAALYATYLANGTDPTVAAALIKSQMPPWLPPVYTIDRPNTWIHDDSLVVDVTTLVQSAAATNIFVDLSDEYVSVSEIQNAFSINTQLSKCTINSDPKSNALLGSVVVYANALGTPEGFSGLVAVVTCKNDTGTTFTVSPQEELVPPSTASASIIVSSAFTFATTTGSLQPYKAGSCLITIRYPDSVLGGIQIDQQTIQCGYIIRTDSYAVVRDGMNPNTPVRNDGSAPEDGGTETATAGTEGIVAAAVFGSIVVALIVGAIVTVIVVSVKNGKKKKQSDTTQAVKKPLVSSEGHQE